MAQYRLSLSIARRSQGRSAVAMAAYRAGEEIYDERTGEQFDFTRKRGILYSEMVLPSDAPHWAKDRAAFWNRSEAADKRLDAHIAREIQLSLPHELSDQERRDLTTRFSHQVAERYNIAVDTCIHAPNSQGDERNHHAHLLLGTRPFDEAKPTGFGNKIRSLDNIAQKKQGKGSDVEQLRELWAHHLNEALTRAEVQTPEGVRVQLDHRSYERQGIDQEPTVKEGVAATGLKRRGLPSERGDINDEIRNRNAQRQHLQTQMGAAARELETLKNIPRGGKAEPSRDEEAATVTEQEKQEQQKKNAQIAEFWERYHEFMQQRAEQEQKATGRQYGMRFDPKEDLIPQVEAKEQQIDLEYGDDVKNLVHKDNAERVEFENWMKEQRDWMRAQDAAKSLDQPKPELKPTFSLGGTAPQDDKAQLQREALRREAADQMRTDFNVQQKQLHQSRNQKIQAQYDLNRDQLNEAHGKEEQRRDVENTLYRRTAGTRTADDLRSLIPEKPKEEPTSQPVDKPTIKPKKGETQEQADERAARMEKVRKKREETEQKDGRDSRGKKDDWSPR